VDNTGQIYLLVSPDNPADIVLPIPALRIFVPF